ncbi:MAG: hypothetical protein R2724_32705 [Bryobacterales bacterium]
MEHLSQEELLLLADGELAEDRAAHIEACAECEARAEALHGGLAAAAAQLRASAQEESPERHQASWIRLRKAIRGGTGAVSVHLEPEEVLLHLDEELAPERALHLETCEACHDELLRVQALMFDIEHELRALIPAEPRERRLVAAAALEQKLYPPKKVVSFPLRWGAVYAAAAALTFAVFGGLWTSQTEPPASVAEPVAAIQEPAPIVVTPSQPAPAVATLTRAVAKPVVAPAAEMDAEMDRAVEPERFEFAFARPLDEPSRVAIETTAAPRVNAAEPPILAFALPTPRLQPAPAAAPAPEATQSEEPANPQLLLAGMRAAVRSGAWASDVTPEIRNGRLTFFGLAGSAAERERLVTAIRRSAGRRH